MAHVEKRQQKRTDGRKGRTVYRVRYIDPSGAERSRTFSTRGAADAYLATVETSKLTGEYHDPQLGRETLAEFFEGRWRPYAEKTLRPSTLGLTDLHWRKYVEPAFGKRRLSSITPLDVKWFVSKMLKEKSIYTAETAFRVLRRLLNAAAEDGLIARSPAERVRPPRRPSRPLRYLNADEVAKLVRELPARWRAFVLVAAYGGLRFGELTALALEHVDFLRRTVRVEEAIVEVGGQLHHGPTKSGHGRAVTLPAFVVEAISEHIRLWPPSDDGPIFTDDAGGPVRRSNWYKRVWWPALKRVGLKRLRFHDLRHTSAALAIAAGAHPKTIQTRLGHHSAAFTLDVYGGLFDGLDAELAQKLDEHGRMETDKSDHRDPLRRRGQMGKS